MLWHVNRLSHKCVMSRVLSCQSCMMRGEMWQADTEIKDQSHVASEDAGTSGAAVTASAEVDWSGAGGWWDSLRGAE